MNSENEEIEELAGSNLYNSLVSVIHSDLKRASADSMFRSECPVCFKGMLMVKRNQATLKLEANDHCILCGQQFVYSDIDELRQKAGEV